MTDSDEDDPRLFAVVGGELHRLPLPGAGGTVHDILAGAPPGVYSGLRTFGGDRFLRLGAHLDRVDANLAALGWDVGFDRSGFRRALHAAVTAYPLPGARVRFDVLCEPARELGASSNVLLALSPLEPVPERFVREGVAVELTGELRRERPRIKTTDFIELRKPYPVGDIDCYEHVLLDGRERLLECTSANFFGVRDGALITAEDGVLEGITRSVFLELADAGGIPIQLEAVTADEVGELDEAFLTSSTRALVPIVRIAGARIGDGRPGPVSERLLAEYLDLAESEAATATVGAA